MNDAPETMPTPNADSGRDTAMRRSDVDTSVGEASGLGGVARLVVPHILIEDPLKVMALQIGIQSRYSSRTVRTQRSG